MRRRDFYRPSRRCGCAACRGAGNLDKRWGEWYDTHSVLGKIMRRRLEAYIPIVLLAILVQLIAPIASFRVVANAVSDPLYMDMASICSGMTSPQDDLQTAPAKTQDHNGNCCAVCAAGHGGAATVDPPPLAFVTLQRQYQLVAWLEAAERMPALRVGSNTQARAPPSIS
ncbi:hypothetical protein V1282_006144 [Nitrobacteraceae bacterium AZCC 2146]